MHFTIITPSFNQLDYLRRCIASVADQIEAKSQKLTADSLIVHHRIQDGESTDGTVDWLGQFDAEVNGQSSEDSPNTKSLTPRACSFSFVSERDSGMYDAINRGVTLAIEGIRHQALGIRSMDSGRTSGAQSPEPSAQCLRDDSVVAWLNCDEQYLPGTLQRVADYFAEHPEIDILTGDYLLVDGEGSLMAYRKGYQLRKTYVEASHLYTLSCATFYRQRVFETVGKFDDSFKAAADEEFILRALRAGCRARHMRNYLSVFTYSGDNLGAGAVADREHLELKCRAHRWVQLLNPAINAIRWCEKWLSGAYKQTFPLHYSIYAGDTEARKDFVSRRAGWKWPGKA